MDRYSNLFRTMDTLRGRGIRDLNFLEIGTFDGVRSSQLINYWLKNSQGSQLYYYGFDLFEDLTKEMSRAEFSKSRLPPSLKQVQLRMLGACPESAHIQLFKGNTKETLAKRVPYLPKMHLIFQDGGHSLETVKSDWEHASKLMDHNTVYLLDDLYVNRPDYGCLVLGGELSRDARYQVTLLDPVDYVESTKLSIRMTEVRLT
jgi:hypothetical protein